MNFTRREILLGTAATLCSFKVNGKTQSSGRLSVEGYIWEQYMASKGKKLGDGLDEIFGMARNAGFHNVELNDGFLTAELRDRVLELIHSSGLSMPSVYVGGAMHEEQLADATIARALAVARFCKGVGCRAIVGDPSPKTGQVEKTNAELKVQAVMLNRMGKALAAEGYQFWVHNHEPEMTNNAREWWNTLNHTNPNCVWICLDLDWVHQGDQDPLALLRAAGERVACLHLRNSNKKLWAESLGDGDIDYRKVAAYLKSECLQPVLMVELAYRPETVITRPLEEDLRLSRVYAEQIFKVKA